MATEKITITGNTDRKWDNFKQMVELDLNVSLDDLFFLAAWAGVIARGAHTPIQAVHVAREYVDAALKERAEPAAANDAAARGLETTK